MSAIPKQILLFSQIFGALPLTYSKTPTSDLISVEFSRILCVKQVATIIFLTVLSLLSLASELKAFLVGSPIRMVDSTNVFAVFLDVISLNVMSLAVFADNLRKYNDFINMCYILERVDQSLKIKLNHRFLVLKVVLTMLYVTGLIINTEYILLNKYGFKGMWHLLDLLIYYVQAALFLQFTFITQSITQRFSFVNRHIERVVNQRRFPTVKSAPEYLKADRLKLLVDSYSRLCEAMQAASSFYSSQLFAAVSSSFIHNIITLYFLVQEVRQRIKDDSSYELFNEVIWVFTHIFHLVLLVWPCTRLAETASGTAPMICRLLSTEILDKEVRQQLETFILELLHYDVGFSALGFFEMHSHILTSIASSVATNLVIMVQLPSETQ